MLLNQTITELWKVSINIINTSSRNGFDQVVSQENKNTTINMKYMYLFRTLSQENKQDMDKMA